MKENLIFNATFNLTQKCNLGCSYCFTGGKTEKVMPFSIAKKGVDFLIKNAIETSPHQLNNGKRQADISFWGGEPLLEWGLLKSIAEYARKTAPSDVRINFAGTTNGTLLTPEKFDFLDAHQLFFLVSLDGTAETHNGYRIFKNGEGSHSTIMRNMEKVLARWPMYKARMSPYPKRIAHFYEDVKYLVEHGIYGLMFSPVYEHEWTEDHWKIWKEECIKVVDLMEEYKRKGINIMIEHFRGYCQADSSKWPCGAGRFYVGFDVDGSIWPCHRFIKFGDKRSWQEKEMCLGHLDVGITKPELRQRFIDFKPKCEGCEFDSCTPCHGGCYAFNFETMGEIESHNPKICKYVEMQRAVSLYMLEKIPPEQSQQGSAKSCICYNLLYNDGTEWLPGGVDDPGVQCHCNNTNYQGNPDTAKVTRPLNLVKINPYEILKRVEALEKRVSELESKKGE